MPDDLEATDRLLAEFGLMRVERHQAELQRAVALTGAAVPVARHYHAAATVEEIGRLLAEKAARPTPLRGGKRRSVERFAATPPQSHEEAVGQALALPIPPDFWTRRTPPPT